MSLTQFIWYIHCFSRPEIGIYISLSEDSEWKWISVLNKLANISAWLGHILYCNTRPAVRIYLTSHIVMLIQISFAYYFMQLAVHSSCNIATNYFETIYNPEFGDRICCSVSEKKKITIYWHNLEEMDHFVATLVNITTFQHSGSK